MLASGGLAVLLAAIAGCGQSSQSSARDTVGPAVEPSSAAVSTIKPERRAIRLTVRQPGSIRAFEETPMYAKIPGYVLKWNVDIGDHVRRGDVLAELYVPEMVEELKQKEEMVKQAREAVEVATARVATAAALIKEAQAGLPRAEYNHRYWRLYYDRISKLEKTLEPQVKDETWNQLQSAAAAEKEAEAKVETSQASSKEAEALRKKARVDVGAAEAERDKLAALLSYTRLKAPYDGVVTRRNINTDDFVQPPTGGKSEPLYVVERRDLMRVQVDVPETDAAWVSKGAKAVVRVQALRGQEFVGQVARTSYALDRSARTLVAEIDLPNPQDRLRPGMYAIASITGEHRNVLALPAASVVTQGDVTQGYQTYCFLVQRGKAVRTPIQLGPSSGEFVEVLRMQTKPAKDGAAEWKEFTGTEEIVATAAGVTDGQSVTGK